MAVREWGAVGMWRAGVSEISVKVADRLPTAKLLFICVSASWAFS